MNFSLLNPGITIGGFTIYYYAIIIVSGIIIASILGGIMFKHRNIPADWLLDFLICILPLGIIGARVYYCAFDPDMKTLADWFSFESIRQGGLAIYGGIIGGAIGVVIFCLIHKINFLRIADCAIPSVVLAQGIRRRTATSLPTPICNGFPTPFISTNRARGIRRLSFTKACPAF